MSPFAADSLGAGASDPALIEALDQLDYVRDPLTGDFRIAIPEFANIAVDLIGAHAQGPRADAIAVRSIGDDGESITDIRYDELDNGSNRFATMLRQLGIGRGDVVAVHTGARIETVIAHLAIYKLGAIAATLSLMYGEDTVRHILIDSGATVLITHEPAWRRLRQVRARCEHLRHVVVIATMDGDSSRADHSPAHDRSPHSNRFPNSNRAPDSNRFPDGDCTPHGDRFPNGDRVENSRSGDAAGRSAAAAALNAPEIDFASYQNLSGNLTPVRTRAEDPALLVYTSGSTGQPKGVLHAHRILHAYKPTLELFNNMELREPNLVLWTAADWAWVGGLIDIVYPALLFGHRLLATQHRFEPEWALDFMARHGVTHILLTPTALNRLAQVQQPRARWPQLKLRTVFTGGEPLPGATLQWLRDELNVSCNEGYGMSEVNHMIGNCERLRPLRPGSMGWVFPGHVAALIDESGAPVADGEVGEIVTSTDAPTLFLGYWKQPDLTAAMRLGAWIRTHDLALRDADGYYWYRGRADDLIKSSGFRIGPVEIEDVLSSDPSVAQCAAIGVPDTIRGQIIRAYVVLSAAAVASDELAVALTERVRQRLGPYKVPRELRFVETLPQTSTGKVARAVLRAGALMETRL